MINIKFERNHQPINQEIEHAEKFFFMLSIS